MSAEPDQPATDAMEDVTKTDEVTPAEGNTSNAEAPDNTERTAEVTRAHGWVTKTEYDYNVYNASTREAREAVEQTAGAPTWASNAAKYEWSEEYGDIGPAHEELEKQLFGNDRLVRSGDEFQKIKEIPVTHESTEHVDPVVKFEDAGLHPIMLQNIKLCRYTVPTPVQAYCLPAILTNHDVIACAQTGSGKTAAFLIPTLSKLMGKAKKLAAPRPNPVTFNPATDKVRAEPLVLVIAPTRELATQIFDEARRFCYRSMLRPCVVYGGAPSRDQREELQKGCDVLIGTPGRLIDFMASPQLLSLSRVKYTIIDEADEMLQSDWQEELKMLMSGGDTNQDADHKYMMFSATFPKEARELAREFLADDHIRIRVGRTGSTHANIKQKIIWTDDSRKRTALFDLLMAAPPTRSMVFVNSKRTADLLDDYLYNLDLPCTSIHADRTQREREDALTAFRDGKTPVLIATGVSARGLDIGHVMHVINFDLPSTDHGGIDEYIHRIGRTARIGNVGLATSFYNDRNEDLSEALVKTLLETGQEIPDFLTQYIPEGHEDGNVQLDFGDDSDKESEKGMETDDKPDDAAAVTDTDAAKPSTDAWAVPAATGGATAATWGLDKPAEEAPAAAGGW
ncbi:MAG: hypothetical protein M1817_001463 [Caeruleum heppii]|nr:MAG: hypothetical protein M1817_001463 [Caeruleum heppii]